MNWNCSLTYFFFFLFFQIHNSEKKCSFQLMINLDDESDVLHNADNLFFIPFMHIWWKEHRYFYDTTFCHSCKCWIHAISGEINLLNNISPLIIWWYWKKKTSICLISKRRQVFSSLMISTFFQLSLLLYFNSFSHRFRIWWFGTTHDGQLQPHFC